MRRLKWATAGVCTAALLAPLAGTQAVAVAQETTRGAGTEDRQWVTGPVEPEISPAAYDVTFVEDASMQARDGTKLSVNLYLPDAAGRFPCLLIQEGYGKADSPQARDFASRGYAVVQADVRGQGASAGQWEPFVTREQQDGYDLVEWTAAQPWCNGKVGTYGTSYMAINQMLTAKQAPPHLVAMIPVQAWGDAYHGWFYKGGMMSLEDPLVYLGLEEALEKRPPSDGDTGAWRDHLLSETILQYQQEYMSHPTRDAFWAERSTWEGDMRAIAERGVKVLFQGAWNDFFLLPELTMYQQFRAAGGEGKLVIGPWTHGGEAGMLPYEFQTMRILWFDRWLKDIDNGMDEGPRVLMNVQGADEWRWEQEWPLPDAKPTRLYLRAEKAGAAPSYNDGSLSLSPPDAGEGAATYPYTPTNVAGGGGLLGAQSPQDQRLDESRSLTWATPPLEQNTELSGPITLRFWGSSTARDTDFVARLVDVAPDGTATQMTRGWLKATHHSSDTDPEPLEPGKTYEFSVTVWPNSNVFAAGHRIRLDLSGSDLPLMTPNPNPAVNTVLQDAEHPSYLEVSVVGSALAAGPVGEQPAEQPTAAPAAAPDGSTDDATVRSRALAATGVPALLAVAALVLLALAASIRRANRAV